MTEGLVLVGLVAVGLAQMLMHPVKTVRMFRGVPWED